MSAANCICFCQYYMITKTLSVLCCLLQSLDCFGLCCRHYDCIDLIVLSWCLQVYSPMYKLYHKFVLSHTNVESVSDCIVVCKQTVSFFVVIHSRADCICFVMNKCTIWKLFFIQSTSVLQPKQGHILIRKSFNTKYLFVIMNMYIAIQIVSVVLSSTVLICRLNRFVLRTNIQTLAYISILF